MPVMLRRVPFSGIILVAALLIAWEISVRSGAVRSTNWPAFSAVLAATYKGLVHGDLGAIVASTLWRMARGYVLGSAAGIIVGVGIALVPAVRATLTPAIAMLRPVPITAIIPPLIFIFGLGDPLKVFSVAFAAFFPVAINTVSGVAGVDAIYGQVARTFGVPPAISLWKITLPAALPFILAGLRTSLGLALVVTVIAEMIAGQDGVGYYLLSMQFALRAPEMYAAIIVLAAAAYALNRLFVEVEGRAIHWARTREARSS